MAIQAVQQGAQSLKILPIGVNYQRKERFRSAVAAMKARNVPIDAKTSVQEIVKDFHAGTLKGHPLEKSVPAGEGLVERK